ncbi:MAG: phospholipid carrier-dependent glycosyltransferase, partial [Acidobacteria bacterium]
MVTTVLALNLASAFIRGGARVSVLGVTLQTPSFRISLLLVAVWLGARFLPPHKERFRPSVVAPFLRARIPELIVGVLFLIGLVLRMSGIGFGEPLILHPDEHQVAGVALTILKAGSLAVPVPYVYPTVFHYLLLPAFGLLYVKGKSVGLWSSLADIDRDTFQFYELARAHSAVLGALTILLTFALARRMWPGTRGRWAGAIAAAYMTFAFNHVKESHHGVTDAALTFFIVLAFLAIVRAFQLGSRTAYALAGFAVGIACATKYSAVPLVAVIVAAHILDRSRWTDWRRLAVAVAAIPVGFFTGYPYALLNWPPFLEHLGKISSYSGSRAFDPDARFQMIVKYAMESGFGAIFTLTFAVAATVAVFRRRAMEALVVVFTVVALSLLSKTALPFYARYLLPIMPPAAGLVGALVVESADWLRRAAGARGRVLVPAAAAAAVVLLVGGQARESFAFVRYLNSPDTRVQAYNHILKYVPEGSTVASEEPYLKLPPAYKFLRWTPLHSHEIDEFSRSGVTVLVLSSDRDAGARGVETE